MKRLAAFVLACVIVLPGMAIFGPPSAVAQARTLNAHSVPLASVALEGSANSTLLTPGNPGHFAGHGVSNGLQLGGPDSYAMYALGGHYATLSGTVFDDDKAMGGNATVAVVDMSARDPHVLYQTSVSGNQRVTFQVAIRGVNHLALEQIRPGVQVVDIVATLAPGRFVPAPAARSMPLESVASLSSGDSKVLTPDVTGHVDGVLIMHGIQLDGNGAYAQYALDGHYSVLTGTLYNDDQGMGTNATVVILDTSGRKGRVLFHTDISLSARTPFRVSVRGVRRLTVTEARQGNPTVDVVASAS